MEQFAQESIVPKTPENEMAEIVRKQGVEAQWWSDVPAMQADHDIEWALETGFAQSIPTVGEGYKIVTKIPQKFQVLEKQTAEILFTIAKDWKDQIKEKGLDVVDEKGGYALMISSLARTIERQQELIAEGYPAVENSTHTKLGAFDIATEWFKKNKPEVLGVLDDVLAQYSAQGVINWIPEDTINAYHIAYNRAKEK